MRSDPMGVLEACYAEESRDQVWLERLLATWAPLLDDGGGYATAFLVDAGRMPPRISDCVTVGEGPPGDWLVQQMQVAGASEATPFFSTPGGLASVVSGLGARLVDMPMWRPVFDRYGFRDAYGMVALDASLRGCVLSVPRRKLKSLTAVQNDLQARLSFHVTSGLRLRRGEHPAKPPPEAVLRPDGVLVHAEGAAAAAHARRALSEATRLVDKARGRMRREDPPGAVAAWRALVDGRWSLVDQFDHDGRRFVVARANAPAAVAAATTRDLSDRERQVTRLAALGHSNKLIAYALGVSPSTVSVHLSSASRKLGVSSRAALLRRVAAATRP